jgi:hypothetical protein
MVSGGLRIASLEMGVNARNIELRICKGLCIVLCICKLPT